ncbi:MAG: 16S rRNA (adenine(1518)-N(6)/adenine(1519)-N(6))-dimethyltransferase RsmA [Candidatus Peribacteraceae bacterium]|jgi:16S rRNA (adenine1518-N6/adenine1519-N6)-dimethyltransferase
MPSLREEVSQFLHRHGLRLNTDLGQHFLVDEDALEVIVESADVRPGETVVEIGPGIGILTRELLRKEATVMAVELDQRLIPLLRQFLSEKQPSSPLPTGEGVGVGALTIVQANALHVSMPESPYKIAANIPYHITSPLLRHVFLESAVKPSSMTILIQKEVAQTICNGGGILTILVKLFGKPSYVADVPAEAFLPPPKVDSAVLHIDCFEKPLTDPATIDRIFSLTKTAFGQKRKMLRNTLGQMPDGMEKLKGVGIDPERRPQTLSVEEWIKLAQQFKQ